MITSLATIIASVVTGVPGRTIASKICFAIAVVIFVLAIFSVTLGTLDLTLAALLFVAIGLLVA